MPDPRDLLDEAIVASGLSARRFAELVLARDERTIRRWRAGGVSIPDTAAARLRWLVALSDRQRDRLVALLTADPERSP